MDNIGKVIKVLISTLMTLIIILGISFIGLYVIGIEPFIVESGSMQPTIQTGSLSFINKKVKYQDIKLNDVIVFETINGKKVTHRAINITSEGIETKGDSNERTDGISTTESNYVGKNIFSIPKLGYVVRMLQTTRGRIMLVTIVIVILIAGFFSGNKKKRGKRFKD